MGASALDPVLAHALSLALAGILLSGACAKVRDFAGFAVLVEDYRLLPRAAAPPAAFLLVAVEALLGLCLLAGARPWAQLGTIALLGIASVAVAVNLARGRSDLSCGCGGVSGDQSLSWLLVARNAVLMAVAGAASLEPAARELQLLDRVVVVAGAAGLVGLYAAANELAANWPRLALLRS